MTKQYPEVIGEIRVDVDRSSTKHLRLVRKEPVWCAVRGGKGPRYVLEERDTDAMDNVRWVLVATLDPDPDSSSGMVQGALLELIEAQFRQLRGRTS